MDGLVTGKGRSVGLTLEYACFFVIVLTCAIFVEITILASDESWWEMCDSVPCEAKSKPALHADLQSCANFNTFEKKELDDVVTLNKLMPLSNRNLAAECEQKDMTMGTSQCDAYVCEEYKKVLMSRHRNDEDVACLQQINAGNGQYITFGSLCCTACAHGAGGDLEAVFRKWSDEWQNCGLFSCRVAHNPHNDFCEARRPYARCAQAFTLLSLFSMTVVAVFHFAEIFSLRRQTVRRIPLPRCISETMESLRHWMQYMHYICALFTFLAAIFLVSTLSLEFCGYRMANYVRPRFGVRAMWGLTAIMVVFGCYYHLCVIGYSGVSKLVRLETANSGTSIPIGAMSANSTDALRRPAADSAPPASDRPIGSIPITAPPADMDDDVEAAPAPRAAADEASVGLELHAIRLSPTEGAIQGDGEDKDAPPLALN